LASLLPDARFVTLESDNHILQEGEPAWDAFLAEVRAFLGDDELAPTDAGDIGELSDREREVLELVARGHDNRRIARELFISDKTVRNHVSSLFGKLDVPDRAEAIRRARLAGMGELS
jgi:DNA-binding NarL/FixJ family response regulator